MPDGSCSLLKVNMGTAAASRPLVFSLALFPYAYKLYMCVCVRACVLGRVLLIKSSGPGVTPTARLPVANQLFRIGCSGIKVDSPLYMHAGLSTASPPARPNDGFLRSL